MRNCLTRLLVVLVAFCGMLRLSSARPARVKLEGTTYYDEEFALDAAGLSASAYCQAAAITTWQCLPCKGFRYISPVGVAYNSSTDTQAYVAIGSVPSMETDSVVISFRGTLPSHLKNWIHNLDARTLMPYPEAPTVQVHHGFFTAFDSVRETIRHLLQKAYTRVSRGAPLIITGHSLGGALATLMAVDMARDPEGFHGPLLVYTFGQPRVGTQAFEQFVWSLISNEMIRVTHYRDIVPHLPPETFGFYHVAREVWYNEASSAYRMCDTSGEDPTCADSLVGESITQHLHYLNISISPDC